jgi:hypothetical protein
MVVLGGVCARDAGSGGGGDDGGNGAARGEFASDDIFVLDTMSWRCVMI